jgi:hypothetical protein
MSGWSHEPNDFLRQEKERAAADAVNEIEGVGKASAPDDPTEEELFQAHMRRFPGQHE